MPEAAQLFNQAQQSQPASVQGLVARNDRSLTNKVRIAVKGLGRQIAINYPADAETTPKRIQQDLKKTLDNKFSEYRNAIDTISQGMTPLQKAALIGGQIPVGGDIAGLLADMEM